MSKYLGEGGIFAREFVVSASTRFAGVIRVGILVIEKDVYRD